MTEIMEDGGQDPKVERSWLTRLNPLKRSRKPPVPEHRAVSPEYRAGFFSLLTFEWMSPIMFVSLLAMKIEI
jgi:ATP-binding cassette subfamily C (CFTR/MRP) protein 1